MGSQEASTDTKEGVRGDGEDELTHGREVESLQGERKRREKGEARNGPGPGDWRERI